MQDTRKSEYQQKVEDKPDILVSRYSAHWYPDKLIYAFNVVI